MPHQRFHVHHSTRDSQVGPPRPKELLGLVMTEAQRVVRRTRAPLHPGEYMGSLLTGVVEGMLPLMKNDRASDVQLGGDVFDKGLNNIVKDNDMDYPAEWRLSRSGRRKP